VNGQAVTDNEVEEWKLAVKKTYEGPNRIVPRFTNEKYHGSQQNWEIIVRECHKTHTKKKKKKKVS
jgi:hypothetical protein